MPPKRKASAAATSKENPNKAARTVKGRDKKEAGEKDVTEEQYLILAEFMRERSNYDLLYDRKTETKAYTKMAEYFVDKLKDSPELIGNISLSKVDATMMENKWETLISKYLKEKTVQNTTGHGAKDDQTLLAADEKRFKSFKLLDSIMAGNPKHDPVEVRNIGALPGAITGFKARSIYIPPVASGSGTVSAASALVATTGGSASRLSGNDGGGVDNDMHLSPCSSDDEFEDNHDMDGTEVPAPTSPLLLPATSPLLLPPAQTSHFLPPPDGTSSLMRPPTLPSAPARISIPSRRDVLQTNRQTVVDQVSDPSDTSYTSVEQALNTCGTRRITYNHEVLKERYMPLPLHAKGTK
ncbi:hypothetical protein BGZ65_009749, partial [Modicella reniformis]